MDLTKLTLDKLRDLARKHLKKGYSKLSKAQLVQALEPHVRAGDESARGTPKPAAKVKAVAKKAVAAATALVSKKRASKEEPVAGTEKTAAPSATKKRVATTGGAPARTTEAAASRARPAPRARATAEAPVSRVAKKVSAGTAVSKAASKQSADAAAAKPAATRATSKSKRPAGTASRPPAPTRSEGDAPAKPSAETAAAKRTAPPPARVVTTATEAARVAEAAASSPPPPTASEAAAEPVRPTAEWMPPRSEREEIASRTPEAPTLELPARPLPAVSESEPRVRSQGGAPAEVFTFAPAPRRPVAPPASEGGPRPSDLDEPQATPEQHAAEPLVEGFFVARVAGEQEVRRHHMVESSMTELPRETSGNGHDEGLGELPGRYAEVDRVIALPRDPSTLFAFWGFKPESVVRASEGLDEPRPVLRLFDDRSFRRQVEIALELPGYYLHSLESGRAYRVEVHLIGRDGRSRRLGPSSNRVVLPAFGPSDDTTVRFMRIPPDVRLDQLREASQQGAVEVRSVALPAFIQWKRSVLPHSATLPEAPAGNPDLELLTGPGFEHPPHAGSSNLSPPRSGRPS